MPQAVIAIGVAVTSFVGAAISTSLGIALATAGAFAVGAATIIAAGMLANKLIANLYEMPQMDTDASRQRSVKSTIEPMKIIYGETLVSGPISFVSTAGEKNKDLWHVIVLAGHECNAITDIYLDNKVISASDIDASGNVTGGTFGPQNAKTVCVVKKHLGGASQVVDPDLDAQFALINSAHIGTGLTYIITKFSLFKASQELWDQYNPQNIKGLVQGKKVYNNLTSTTAWSDNPVWCLIDYLTNTDYGMGVDTTRIDWDAADIAAAACDVVVDIPSGTEKRFTCNGVLFGTDTHKTNINKILSSMNGMLTFSNGKFVIRAGVYEAPTISLNENHLQGAISLKTSVERSDRFNTVTGTFIDPTQNYKSVEFNTVQIAEALARDNAETLTKEIQLPMTNSQYMAQRIGYKLIKQSDLQKTLIFPANLAGVQVAVGSRVNVSIAELGWTDKVFVCLGWSFSDSGNGGVNLTLREDNESAYADPDPTEGDYTVPTALGTLPDSFSEADAPSDLVATGGLQNITLEWTNPEMENVLYIEVYASATSAWSGAKLIGTTVGTQFIHGSSNKNDPIGEGDTRYYWVRARNYDFGDNANAVSDRFPNSDTSTVIASAGAVPSNALSVSGSPVYGFNSGPSILGTVTSANASLTVSGGTSPYTYSWSHVSTSSGNTPSISSSTASNPTFTATVSDNVSSVSSWQVTVTDNASATASTYVSVTLTWFDSSGGAIP